MAKVESAGYDEFPPVEKCVSTGREGQTVVADLDGTLLRGRSSFPYFAIIAFELGGILRMAFLLLAAPLAGLLYYFVSETAGIQVLIFSTFVGAKISDIESIARAVVPKFYSEDLHPESWRVFSSCGKRCVLTANPRIMVEAFLKDYLGADMVIGTEISSVGGRATGFVKSPGVLVGSRKADALVKAMADYVPDVGLGDRKTDFPFMRLCKRTDLFWFSKALHFVLVVKMEDNPPPPSPPRDWVCKKCGKTFATKTSHNAHQKTHGRYGKNQIVAPQRAEQPPEAWLGPRTRSFFTGSSPVRKVELGIGPDPSGRDPDNRPPTFYQFLPLPKEDKAGPKGS